VFSDMKSSKLVNHWSVSSVLFNVLMTRMLTHMNMCLCRDCIDVPIWILSRRMKEYSHNCNRYLHGHFNSWR